MVLKNDYEQKVWPYHWKLAVINHGTKVIKKYQPPESTLAIQIPQKIEREKDQMIQTSSII